MKKNPEYYILVSKSLIRTWIASTIVLVIIILASFQYANYVDRRSNRQWCGVVLLFDESNRAREVEPQSELDKRFIREFDRLQKQFECN